MKNMMLKIGKCIKSDVKSIECDLCLADMTRVENGLMASSGGDFFKLLLGNQTLGSFLVLKSTPSILKVIVFKLVIKRPLLMKNSANMYQISWNIFTRVNTYSI